MHKIDAIVTRINAAMVSLPDGEQKTAISGALNDLAQLSSTLQDQEIDPSFTVQDREAAEREKSLATKYRRERPRREQATGDVPLVPTPVSYDNVLGKE